MQSKRVLAIDLGASNMRGMVGDFDGKTLVLTPVHSCPNKMIPIRDSYYWDILRLYDETVCAIQKAKSLPGGPVVSVAIDGWAQDFGLLDAEGNLLGGVHSYRDPYSAGMAEKFADSMSAESFYAHTGLAPKDMMSLSQLMGLREKEKVVYENAHTFLFVPDLIKYLLTGVKSCSISLAALSGLVDIHKGDWSDAILDYAGLRRIFPPIAKTCDKAGEISGIGGIGPLERENRIQFPSIAAHDTASAMSFIPGRSKSSFLISSGTWSVAGHAIAQPESRLEAMRMDLLNELGFDEELFLLANLTGLWLEQELLKEWGESHSSLDGLYQAAEKSEYGYCFDTQLPVFHTPGGMEEKILAALSDAGHPLPQDRPALYRCVVLSLACKYRETIENAESLCAGVFDEIRIVGGGSKNSLLNQLTADVCGKPVVAGPFETTAIGNIAGQLIALGEVKDMAQAQELIACSFERKEFIYGNKYD